MAIAERVYGLRARLVVARRSGSITGVLPLVCVPRPLGRYLTTGLFGAYGPVLAADPDTKTALLDAARRVATELDVRYVHIKSLGDEPAPHGFSRHDLWVTAMLPLEGGADAVWASFKSSIRAAVRQALRAGFELRSGPAQLDAFYDVLAENMHRKGSPIYGRAFVHALHDALGARADVVTLWRDGVPVSGAFTITHGDVFYVPFASSLARCFKLRPNNLLYWRLIERACASGHRVFDFGTSMRGASTLAFKLHWGATMRAVPSYVWTRTSDRPQLVPVSRAAQTGVALWKMLPRTLADALGPQICRVIL
jgi:FemAB-related protein (PEP-CTERM system-associated)